MTFEERQRDVFWLLALCAALLVLWLVAVVCVLWLAGGRAEL